MIVGAGNSGVEAALELYRHDVHVTLVARGEDLKPTAKYWLVPDIKNRIKEGKITLITNAEAVRIDEKSITLDIAGETRVLQAEHVFLLVGYLPDGTLLEDSGLKPEPISLLTPHNTKTYETDVKGLYLCGTILAGIHTEKVFIENGREHAIAIAEDIEGSF